MNLTKFAVEKRFFTWFVLALVMAGGLSSLFSLGQLEDPVFSIKTALVTTPYPGASPTEVELEVTDKIEIAVQELSELYEVSSMSRAGQSLVTVEVEGKFWADKLPELWDKLRNKVADIQGELPPGAGPSVVSDDFGFVYGFILAVTGDGFSAAELEKYADHLKKELSLVEGVARVDLWGEQPKCVYVDISEAQLSELGLTPADVLNTLSAQNLVVDAGELELEGLRLRVAPGGQFTDPGDIADLTLRASGSTRLKSGDLRDQSLVTLGDVAEVKRGYSTPTPWEMRFNGEPAIGIAIAPREEGTQVIGVGQALQARIDELMMDLPVGIEIETVAFQSDLVSASLQGFMISLAQAVAIVVIVLAVSMGIRMGLIISITGLIFVILGSFLFMALWGIDLQRMSLGALIISMGMMVDNAIVVADGYQVRLKQGMDRLKAAVEWASLPLPLLGATVIAVMAFYPIFAAKSDTGEYCRSLFQVVAIALLFSWVLAVAIVPLTCMALIRPGKSEGGDAGPPPPSKFENVFKGLLGLAIRFRIPFLLVMIGLLVISAMGFGMVEEMFFPMSARAQVMVDYWAPEGSSIRETSAGMRRIENLLRSDDRVESVSTFVGQGPPRFYLPVDPESPYPSYGQLIVNLKDWKELDAVIAVFEPWCEENLPEILTRVRKFAMGPSDTWPFEAQFSGPAEADMVVLRRLGEQGKAILERSPQAKEIRLDVRQRVRKVVPQYDQKRGRWTGVVRGDVANAMRRATDGLTVGLYREGDDLMPINLRLTESVHQDATSLSRVQVLPPWSSDPVALSEVTEGIDLDWEDPIIWRIDRRRTVSVQCAPKNSTFPSLYADVIDEFNAIEMPPGYKLSWGGEAESLAKSQKGLAPGYMPMLAVMALVIMGLFNAGRPPLIILCLIPFAVIGITSGLLLTGSPFGFMALLGAMSLVGMMVKNAVVLLDQIGIDRAEREDAYTAVVEATVSRLRPVMLAAATTILGMVPLLPDPFWVSMAVTIMFGLLVGTILTLVLLPVIYTLFFRIKRAAN